MTALKTLPLLAFVALAACAPEPRPLVPAAGPPSSTATGCPLGIPGAKISVEDVQRGVVVTLTATDPAVIDRLRKRVWDIAEQYGPGAHRGSGHDGTHGDGGGHGLRLSELPPINTSFQSWDAGARLHVLAVSDSDVRQVQIRMYERVEQAAAGKCE